MISVIVPIYNEEENINTLVECLLTELSAYEEKELIFVDDGSKDASFSLLEKAAQQNACIKVVKLVRNTGQTAAIQAGIDISRGEILVFCDADLQNDPKDIPALLHKLDEGYDVVSGWRKDRRDNAIKRNLPSRIANSLISTVSGVQLHDYGCTLKAYRRSVLANVRLYGEMHRFIPIYAVWQGAKVTEMPVTHHARAFGKSKYGLERIFKVILDICVVKFLDKYLMKPIYIFGGCGLAAFAVAFLAFLWALSLKFFAGVSFVQTPLPLLIAFSTMIGFLCILMGLLAEVLSRTYFESQGRQSYVIEELVNIKRENK